MLRLKANVTGSQNMLGNRKNSPENTNELAASCLASKLSNFTTRHEDKVLSSIIRQSIPLTYLKLFYTQYSKCVICGSSESFLTDFAGQWMLWKPFLPF